MYFDIIDGDLSKKLDEIIIQHEEEKGNFDFYEELKEKMRLDDFNSPTLYYYITSFFDACNINVLKGDYVENTNGDANNFFIKKHEDENLNYSFEILKSKINKKDVFLIKGKYNDLDFSFYNFYRANKLDEEIKQIPFILFLTKNSNKNEYTIEIQTIRGQTKYFLQRKPLNKEVFSDQYSFISKRNDFENVFGVIKSFVDNPEYVFFTYKGIILEKPIILNSSEIDLVKKNDELLVTKHGKVLKKTTNNRN